MLEFLWATPVYRSVVEESQSFNTVFEAYALELSNRQPSTGESNVGGWHSQDDLFDWPLPEIAQLKSWIFQGVQTVMEACSPDGQAFAEIGYRCSAWANVSRRGAYHLPHTHPNSSWSGVYYVSTGEDSLSPDQRGSIAFVDPRAGVNMFSWPGSPFDRQVTIDPQPSMLLIFPSWLSHYVQPFDGQTHRISIAFNFVVTEARRRD